MALVAAFGFGCSIAVVNVRTPSFREVLLRMSGICTDAVRPFELASRLVLLSFTFGKLPPESRDAVPAVTCIASELVFQAGNGTTTKRIT